MSKWKSFWDGLNIRKFLAVIASLLFFFILVGGMFNLGGSQFEKIMNTAKDILMLIIGFYFGYSSGVKGTEKSENV